MNRLLPRRVVVLAGLVLVGLFVVRPEARRLQGRVSQSIAQSLGRGIEISSLHLRFLPRPGFELDNLVVRDNPAFGAEPLLRAPQVTAWVSIAALLRGHVEVSSLTLEEASLNLSRNNEGRWNLEDLLQRASRTAMAPTGSSGRAEKKAFPYVEASGARINFKLGIEKTHFALTNAEFALWQESDNTWGMRLKAAPIRTDANLTDTGSLTLSGIWQRAGAVHQTPVLFSYRWQKAQIGQLSELFYATDKGWRGGMTVSGSVTGTPEHLTITSDGLVDDFRRQDIIGGGTLRLMAHCAAHYDSVLRNLSNLDCFAPSADGMLELKGSATGVRPFSSYDFQLVASKVPAEAVLAVARHINPRFSDDVTAGGNLNATIEIRRNGDGLQPQLKGGGAIDQFRLSSSPSQTEIQLETVPFSFIPGGSGEIASRHLTARRKIHLVASPQPLNPLSDNAPRLEIGPVNLAVGKTGSLSVGVTLTLSGYHALVRGDSGVKRLLQLASISGIPAPSVNAEGRSTVDLTVAGSWAGTERPLVLGTARLHSVQAQVRGLNAPIFVSNANLTISDDLVAVKDFEAVAADATWHGSLQIPRPCSAPDACQIQFNLHTVQLRASALNTLLNPALTKAPWYGFLSLGPAQKPYLLQVQARGKIAIDETTLGTSSCSHLTGNLQLAAGRVIFSNVRGDAFDGHAKAELKADFTTKPAKFSGSGTLEGIALDQIADLMNDRWIEGTGTASFEFTAAGGTLQDLLDSADLATKFNVFNGRFPHVVLGVDSAPLRAEDFSGKLDLHDSQFSIHDAKLENANGVYTVSGTASLQGALDLKITTENAAAFNVTGTLVKTRVSAVPTSQAALK